MPNRDGTGPQGDGPLTGRGMGKCKKGKGAGKGQGNGQRGRGGRGRGLRRRNGSCQRVDDKDGTDTK